MRYGIGLKCKKVRRTLACYKDCCRVCEVGAMSRGGCAYITVQSEQVFARRGWKLLFESALMDRKEVFREDYIVFF